ncbi:lysine-2,3-aminomutase-like protein [Cypionkella sp.]|uniref:lysine-2,3-aminomutase-like protein n=1 Tax=Cypionkella sp. TaxID=2811411 RepID=UPI00272491EB|nr:lysine-2,3-aminomutase-like protein [Cypionkella sp.]MDO8983919.1 lysine-2,3-aminomutase-like protein [Cypionkella sp.]MDP2049442.1 lysine-2,3-aminomutase-like protein [Cypionkella sp.]
MTILPQRALTRVEDLIEAGLAPADRADGLQQVAEAFRIRVSPEMQAAMIDADDAIARQFLPDTAELTIRPEELYDPIGDITYSPTPGLTHRYPDRVILAATHTCEVYCRFCFRREAVGEEGALPEADLEAALAYIAATPAIWEVILTGGDPLVLSPRRLSALMQRLSAIPHVEIVRFHTRVPVVAPARITDDMIAALRARPTTYLVLHTNHAQEITPAAQAALKRLADAGIPLLSQTVLLKGINDSAATLESLFRTLLRHRVTPYYLHHCDLARGTSHFRTTIAAGQAIMAQLRGRLSGIGLPTYVLDIPGGFGKVPIGPGYVEPTGDAYQITDWQGRRHAYRDPDAP